MYKNFTLTESERKEILEMHMSYGYKKPLKEEYIDVDNNIDEDDIITEISLEGVSSEGNPIIKMVMRSAIGETKQTAEFTNITVICEWKMLKSWRAWDRKKRLTDTYIINNVLDIKSDIQLPQKAIQFLNNIFKINSNYYSVIKEIYKPYVDFLYSKKDLDKEKYTNLISKIEGYISMNVDNFGKLLSDFKWKNYDKQVGTYKYQNISVDDENISSDKKNQPEPMDKKINSPINKKSMWTSTNTWSGPNLNIVQSK